MGAFRDTVVKQAVKVANETATAAAARAKATAGAPPPPRPPSCADKYCIYLALRPMFEEGEGLCICTFSYLAPAAAAARVGRGAMLLCAAGGPDDGRGVWRAEPEGELLARGEIVFWGGELESVYETFVERRLNNSLPLPFKKNKNHSTTGDRPRERTSPGRGGTLWRRREAETRWRR